MDTSIVNPEAWECHQRIVQLRFFIERSFLEIGGYLHWMKTNKAYKSLGHPTFESYIADPDVDIGRTSAYIAIQSFEVFVQQLNMDETRLIEAGISKLALVAPYVDEDNKEELITMATALSRSDLRDMLNQMFGADATPPLADSDDARVECPNCGQRFDIKGYIIKENA